MAGHQTNFKKEKHVSNKVTFDSALYIKQSPDSLLNLLRQDYTCEKRRDMSHDNGKFEFNFISGADHSRFLHIEDRAQKTEFLLRLVSESPIKDEDIEPLFSLDKLNVNDAATKKEVEYDAISPSFMIECDEFVGYCKIFNRVLKSNGEEYMWMFVKNMETLSCYVGDIVPAGMVFFGR